MRPTLIIQAYKLDIDKFNHKDFLRAVYQLQIIMEDYMFFPGKVENWNVFIDMASREFH